MSKRMWSWIGGLVVLAALGMIAPQVASQEKGAAAGQEPPDMAEMMAQWAEANAMGPEHEHMKGMVGSWDALMRMWMAPGAPPTEIMGRSEQELILGGRFLRQDFTCSIMGMPFEGMGYTGYDRYQKKFISIWMDNQSNAALIQHGTVDASGKVFTYFGTMDDPMQGVPGIFARSVIREESNDRVVMEMYENRPGEDEVKTMEIVYTRRK